MESDDEEEQIDVDFDVDVEEDLEVNMDVDQEQEASEDDLEVLEEPPEVFMTPGKKKKPFKIVEQLDDSFLRRSRRLSKKTDGFKDAKSTKEASSAKSPKKAKGARNSAKKSARKNVAAEEEPIPLPIIPPVGTTAAPHLSKEILQGIGEGFLQI